MKKALIFLFIILAFLGAAVDGSAQVKISDLTAATTASDSMMFVIVTDSSGVKVSRKAYWIDFRNDVPSITAIDSTWNWAKFDSILAKTNSIKVGADQNINLSADNNESDTGDLYIVVGGDTLARSNNQDFYFYPDNFYIHNRQSGTAPHLRFHIDNNVAPDISLGQVTWDDSLSNAYLVFNIRTTDTTSTDRNGEFKIRMPYNGTMFEFALIDSFGVHLAGEQLRFKDESDNLVMKMTTNGIENWINFPTVTYLHAEAFLSSDSSFADIDTTASSNYETYMNVHDDSSGSLSTSFMIPDSAIGTIDSVKIWYFYNSTAGDSTALTIRFRSKGVGELFDFSGISTTSKDTLDYGTTAMAIREFSFSLNYTLLAGKLFHMVIEIDDSISNDMAADFNLIGAKVYWR